MVELRNLNSDPFAALIFKTTSEPHVGELSYFRVFGGSVSNGQEVLNPERGQTEKLAHLSIPQGKERQEVEQLRAGDIGVVAKLRNTHTNDTLCAPAHPLRLAGVELPEPDIAVALEVETRGEEDKLSHALHMLHEEDPCFSAEYDPVLGQTIARGCGELHLEVQVERMRRKHNVGVVMREPRIPIARRCGGAARRTGATRSRRAGAASSATATCGCAPSVAARGTDSSTRSSAA